MSGRFLLDTNIVIALFADEAIVKDNLAQASEVFIPSIVIGERRSSESLCNSASLKHATNHFFNGWIGDGQVYYI